MATTETPSASPAAEPPALPPYLSQRAAGLYVDATALPPGDDFTLFVDRLFISGRRFAGLDYDLFQRLLFSRDTPLEVPLVRLAECIVPFEEARRALYKGVKIDPKGEKAEYLFEPVALEVQESTPRFTPPEREGEPPGLEFDVKTYSVPTKLDFDEFVADMWVKGVRFGLQAERIRQTIAQGSMERVPVALMLAPTEGSDAGIEEVTNALHRDNSPRMLRNGRHDLRQFTNRYPQIGKDAVLLKKIPRTFGSPGYTVGGAILHPTSKPKDFELATLAGPGTRVERRPDGEYIVSSQDGFLNIDAETNQVSITEKVVNKEGISLRTTGDLSLSGEEFETHGDVQERRVVEGKHMTFHGDVFGSIQSRAGNVLVEGNIVGGRADSPGGSVTVQGRASQATLEADRGEIRLKFAEGSRIAGSRVYIERAINCEIIAESLAAESLESCQVAARSIQVANATVRKDRENRITLLVPDLDPLRNECIDQAKRLKGLDGVLAGKNEEMAQLRSPDLGKFIALDSKVRKGELKLSDAQLDQLHKAANRYKPIIQRLRALAAEVQKLTEERANLVTALHRAEEVERNARREVSCRIDSIAGELVVNTTILAGNPLGEAQRRELERRLRKHGPELIPLYSGRSGGFAWNFEQTKG